MGGERHSASAHRASWKTCGGARPLGLCTSVDFDQVILDNFWELGCASSASCPGQNGYQSVAVRLCAHGVERVACRNPVVQIWNHQPPGTLEARREACPKVRHTESQVTTRGAAKSVFGNEWLGPGSREELRSRWPGSWGMGSMWAVLSVPVRDQDHAQPTRGHQPNWNAIVGIRGPVYGTTPPAGAIIHDLAQ